ncbi:SH2 domain-containing adapter protein B [Tachyglossus aculeatus]|uniref:SH2 domain-containing adapter protein B n=1 Tax=Tachyglossus aculeatus TaxID=9261 RepID=UPI0018F45A92|nr:SH2 domain-containing adapter protein B [Tachyglossus aculeatus]
MAPAGAAGAPPAAAGRAVGGRPRASSAAGGTMAKWLNKYFSLGNNKTKSPPQPPRPDYRERRGGGGGSRGAAAASGLGGERGQPQPVPCSSSSSSSCFSSSSFREEGGSTSDLIRAYRAQKERDFEDPYNGPGSSLRKLRAMCRLDYCGGQEGGGGGGERSFSAASSSAGCCCTSGAAAAASSSSSSSSPHLFRSNSERRPATPPEVKYISPKHRLIKIDSGGGGGGCEGAGGGGSSKSSCSSAGSGSVRTWSPSACGAKKLLNKCPDDSGAAAKKDKVIIADDYSDPFDAKSELKNKTGKGESTGYMEPYEAQRIMTEFQRQESVKSQHKSIQLYDTPYEPEGNGVESDSESVVSQRLRESKLPQDDDRPADEYDQPWEWNKVTIPALAEAAKARNVAQCVSHRSPGKGKEALQLWAAQFNGNEKRQSSPSPSRDRRRQLRAPGGGFKPIKHGSPEFCGILGERVDPTVPLEKQIWYHGAISRTDAENLLRLCKECSYLVRNSQTSKHDYSLSLKSSQGFMHMKLTKTKEKYILGQNSPPFDSVPEVIHYYTTKKLPIKGAEHLSLLYPVAVRTL